ncbi:MAG: hypothetical protein SFU98_08675 [Leptospiraceae bacterium]|nr:hypothetical protein [Leptospiraceae bacterium]
MKIFIYIVLSFTLSLYSTEERESIPFYSLEKHKVVIKPIPSKSSICRAKTKNIFGVENIKKIECYSPYTYQFKELIRKTIEDAPEKKEFSFYFFDEAGEVLKPRVLARGNEYEFISLSYLKKEKKTYIELLDKNSKYFYFLVSPEKIRFKSK